jgi:hypothetical protein
MGGCEPGQVAGPGSRLDCRGASLGIETADNFNQDGVRGPVDVGFSVRQRRYRILHALSAEQIRSAPWRDVRLAVRHDQSDDPWVISFPFPRSSPEREISGP